MEVCRFLILATLIALMLSSSRVSGTNDVLADTKPFYIAMSNLDRGHRLLMGNGFQVAALVDRTLTNISNWNNSKYTTVIFTDHQAGSGGGAAGRIFALGTQLPGSFWGRLTWSGETEPNVITDKELSYLPNLTLLQYLDERSITNSTIIADDKATLAAWRARYPDAIGFTNQYGYGVTESALKSYMNQVQPDMLCFDYYPFTGSTSPDSTPSTDRNKNYNTLQLYRSVAILGHDLTGERPIPCGMYTQNTDIPGDAVYNASGSEIALHYFSALAFGFKMLCAFTYARPKAIDGLENGMFSSANTIASSTDGQTFDTNPLKMYYNVASLNQQTRNLGSALVRLLSTNVYIKRGLTYNGAANTKASNVNDWTSTAVPYLTGVSSVNTGGANNGNYGDVVFGVFKPLLSGFHGDRDTYFMVVNGLTYPNTTSAQTQQTITLTFNFGNSGMDSLQRLNRTTGHVEIVPLKNVSGSVYRLDLPLGGGYGDLFKFNTGKPFIGTASEKVGK